MEKKKKGCLSADPKATVMPVATEGNNILNKPGRTLKLNYRLKLSFNVNSQL